MGKTITQDQAAAKAEAYVRQAVSVALPVDVRLEIQYDKPTSCDDPTDHGPLGRVEVGPTYWVHNTAPAKNPEYFAAMLRFWAEHGFVVLDDSHDQIRFVSVENRADGFRMSLQESTTGDLTIGASSPCVWPNGTPEPTQ